ncbi:MAG: hypothetical protein AAFX56_17895 [Pseudomonadota bacterium]
MKTLFATCALALSLLCGCALERESDLREVRSYERSDLPNRTDRDGPFPGEWEFRSGVKICKGYLTRSEDEDFCASSIPRDWTGFEFDGRTYYWLPLAAAGPGGQ